MGGGSSTSKPQTMQEQLLQQQQKQVKSVKYPPFNESEVFQLQKKFKVLDKDNRNAIKIEDIRYLLELRMHFFRERIYQLMAEDLRDMQRDTMTFEIFMKFLTVFHPQTDNETKLNYMFRLYDYDANGTITQDDLVKIFSLLFMKTQALTRQSKKQNRVQILTTNFMNEEYVKNLGKDVMNIVDDDKSNSIDLDEFKIRFTESDIRFRMNIVF